MSIDTLGDFLTIIRNGVLRMKRFVVAPYSHQKFSIVKVLKEEGLIKDFQKLEQDAKPYLKIYLKYKDGESVIHEIKRMSKPGRRKYEGLANMTSVIGGLGVSILSTNRGIMTDRQAKKISVGGEVICHIW